jgi:hypothetical protein
LQSLTECVKAQKETAADTLAKQCVYVCSKVCFYFEITIRSFQGWCIWIYIYIYITGARASKSDQRLSVSLDLLVVGIEKDVGFAGGILNASK